MIAPKYQEISIANHTLEVNVYEKTVCLVGTMIGNENLEVRQTLKPSSNEHFEELLEKIAVIKSGLNICGLRFVFVGEKEKA